MANVIAIRASADNQHARNAESDAIKGFCDRLGLPSHGLEWSADLASALDRGTIVVARSFSDLFKKPSEVEPLLMRAIAKGRKVFSIDLGELTAILPQLRILCGSFVPLETEIATLHDTVQHQEEAHHVAVREAAVHAVRRVLDMQLTRVLEDVAQEATDRAFSDLASTQDLERWATPDDLQTIIANINAKQKAA